MSLICVRLPLQVKWTWLKPTDNPALIPHMEMFLAFVKAGTSYLNITNWAERRGLQVTNNASLAEGVQALDDGGGIHKVAGAEHTHQVGVELRQFHAA